MSLARLGQRVVLLDAQIGIRNLDLLLGLEKRIVFTAMDVFNESCTLEQALVKDKRVWSTFDNTCPHIKIYANAFKNSQAYFCENALILVHILYPFS